MSKSPLAKIAYMKAKEHEAELLGKIAFAHAQGRTKRADFWTKRYLNSRDVKFAHAVQAHRELPRHRRNRKIDFDEIAERVDPFKGTAEQVRFNLEKKESGYDRDKVPGTVIECPLRILKSWGNEFRPIMDFGIEHRTMQRMALAVLRARSELLPYQFANAGGVNAAVAEVLKNLGDGYRACAQMDIFECFPSVGGEKLPGLLPISEAVVKHVLTCENLCLIPGSTILNWVDPDGEISAGIGDPDLLAETIAEGRWGIPQGSVASSYVMELLLVPILSGAPEDIRLVSYADNILVMGRTYDAAMSMLKNLGEALWSHPAGPFVSRLVSKGQFGEDFEFLGYELQISTSSIAVPSYKNLARFQWKFDTGIDALQDESLGDKKRRKIAKSLRQYVRSWCAAFRHWPKAATYRKARLKDIGDPVIEFI